MEEIFAEKKPLNGEQLKEVLEKVVELISPLTEEDQNAIMDELLGFLLGKRMIKVAKLSEITTGTNQAIENLFRIITTKLPRNN